MLAPLETGVAPLEQEAAPLEDFVSLSGLVSPGRLVVRHEAYLKACVVPRFLGQKILV